MKVKNPHREMNIQVSVIIVAYNSSQTITDCLISLNAQTFKDFEAIIVDNNSEDDTRQIIETVKSSLFFSVKTIYLDENSGFAAANNIGLRYAGGRYIALLNPDAVADIHWLERLAAAMDAHQDVGICASKMIAHDNNIIDSAGDIISSNLKGFKRGEGMAPDLYDREEYIFGACAGAALYRRKMLDEIGFFDEDFFLIHEDTDLNFRAQLAGWKVLYVPAAIAYHKVRSSIGHMSDRAVYYSIRNIELVRFKNIPVGIFIRCLHGFIIHIITEFLYFALKHKKFGVYFKAKKDALRMFPGMLRKRVDIMKHRKVGNGYLHGMMTPLFQKDFILAKIKKFIYG